MRSRLISRAPAVSQISSMRPSTWSGTPESIRSDAGGEGLDQARAGAPHDVKAGHRVAVAGGEVTAALGPPRVRQQPHAVLAQPRPLLPRGKLDVRLRPPSRPRVLGPVKPRAA